MTRLRTVWIIAMAAAMLPWPALAALKFAADTTNDGIRYIVVTGEFSFDDDLSRFSAEVVRRNSTVVSFDSPGGNVSKAMELGRLIRHMGLATLQFRQLECASSCALAFMGGKVRIAEAGAIGVHRSYFEADLPVSSAEAVQHIQAMTAQIVGFMTEMGVDPGLLQLSLAYGSDDVRYLSRSEMAQYRVTTPENEAHEPNETGAPSSPPQAQSYAVPDPPHVTPVVRAAAAELVQSVIGSHKLPVLSAIELVRDSYAAEIHYYGKRTRLFDVLEDKRDYFERWPERFYAVRPGSLTVECSNAICQVSGIYDWSVRSLPRNKKASGTATFGYLVDTTTGRIVGENSQVISR